MRYLVCRLEAVRSGTRRDRIKSSEYWPIVVEVNDLMMNMEQIVKKALNSISVGYIGMHQYLVVPLDERASVVSFTPRPTYDTVIHPYLAMEP